ncbi:phosphoadenosine phosphosulfate reductase [Cladorrhinum sp. PSN332]|nr:phosphoadenosine phosphosulfate reductase [Cladorrhinum sp. PSN332]
MTKRILEAEPSLVTLPQCSRLIRGDLRLHPPCQSTLKIERARSLRSCGCSLKNVPTGQVISLPFLPHPTPPPDTSASSGPSYSVHPPICPRLYSQDILSAACVCLLLSVSLHSSRIFGRRYVNFPYPPLVHHTGYRSRTPTFLKMAAEDLRDNTTSSRSSSNGDDASVDSGFASTGTSTASLPTISLTPAHIKHLNQQLENMNAMDILRFSKVFFPNLYQTTAFGLTGLATIDMLSKLQAETPGSQPVELIFLDTLYHFQETHELVDRVKERYGLKMHVFKPLDVETTAQFEETYGEKLYEISSELYDWVAKVEPQQRAYSELKVGAVLTGRRRSQGGQRGSIPVIEIDEERGIVKINPLVNWTFKQVKAYIDENNVPYNALLDRGYKSVGDWHSTVPVGEGEDERAGRWKGQEKTECGIHNKQSRYAQWLANNAREQAQQTVAA